MRKSRNILLVALAVVTAGSWLLAWSVPVSAQEGMLTPNLAPPSPNSGGPVSPGSRAQDGPITGLESILAMAGAVPSPGGAQVAGAGVREAPPGARLLLGGYTTMPVINDGNKDLTGGGDLEIEVEIAPMNSPSQGIADSVITGAAAIIWDAKAPNPNDSPGDYWQWVPAEDDEVDYVGRDSADVDTVILKMASPYRTFYTPPFFVPPLLAFPLDGAGRYITQFDLTPTADAPKTPGATVFKGTLPDVLGQLGAGEFYVGIDVWGTATVRDTPDTSWRFVFDNLTGFYTEPFVSTANVLLVDDYIRGQNWVDAARGERGGGPVEESSYRSVGFPVDEEWGVSYNAPQWLDGNKGFKRVGQAPNDIVYGSGSAAVFDTTFADYWRVACRGPLPDAIAERYLPEAIPFRHPSETDMDDPTLGPFVVGQSSGPGIIPPITPTDLYVQKKAMLWVAPYAGNLFADKGSITDPMAQAVIEGFVAQGGAILMSGGDIAWALTLNGAVNSSFLANVFGASFVADDVGNVYGKLNGLAHDDVDIAQRAGSTRGDYPLVESGNPLSLPPNNSHPWWQGWQSGNTTNPTELRLSYHPPGAVNGNFYTDGAVGLSRRMSPLFQQHWPDVIAPVGTAKVAYEYATGGAAAVYMQHPQAAPARGGRTAFLSFGLEAVSRQFTKYDPWGNGDLQVECLMLRNKVISNFLSWNRTSRIQGTVTAGAGIPGVPAGSPIAGALVVCEPITGQGHPVIGMFTDADGFFLIEGMAIDSYRVTAYAPGLAADHAAGEFTWPQGSNMEYASEEGFSMSIAPNGSISGTVTDEAGAPIEGIVVSAAGMLTTGDAITNPLTNEPIVGQATTDANGDYTITDLLSGISYAVTANPEPKVGDQANYATDNTTYSVENTSLVPVSPATETKDIDFALATVPGNVTGLVFEEGTNPKLGIAGAVVTVVGTDPALETTAGAKGAYNFGVDPFVVPAGTRTLRATAPGYEPGTITVDINANETTTDADIPLVPIPPGTITGRVTQSDGTTGVAGIQVQTWFGPVGSLVAGATTTTGADGAFTFGNIEAGVTYTLRATDPALGRNLTPDAGFRVTVEAGVTHTEG
ncbi:MAG: carboxypeptidase regulatory-like domain-containing protein [Armatimonadota bacterium]